MVISPPDPKLLDMKDDHAEAVDTNDYGGYTNTYFTYNGVKFFEFKTSYSGSFSNWPDVSESGDSHTAKYSADHSTILITHYTEGDLRGEHEDKEFNVIKQLLTNKTFSDYSSYDKKSLVSKILIPEDMQQVSNFMEFHQIT